MVETDTSSSTLATLPPYKRGTRLRNRVAIVTGGSSGIGREICLAYAAEGAIVINADLRESSVDVKQTMSTSALIQRVHGADRGVFMEMDVKSSKAVNTVVDAVVKRFGRLDIMVNNAGTISEILAPNPINGDCTDDFIDHILNLNLKGVFYCSRAASKAMEIQEPLESGDRGWIINVSSIFGHLGAENAPLYTATKHAVNGLTRSSAVALGQYNIHVNAICPGFVQTTHLDPMMPMKQIMDPVGIRHSLRGLGKPEWVAGAAVFLASDDAKWVNGECMVVDGGYAAH